jgi:MFS family permease
MISPMTQKQSLSDLWLKAAIAGGLWASVEIIIGSFLHNLRVPFAGSILAGFGVVLMIAFLQLWPERGLIIRAGIVCALMKSISPSAVILGPMTGILAEALLMELGVLLFGRSLPGFLIAGALALFSALIHKVVSLLILFGTNIFRIYLNLFQFASRQINIPDADPAALIAWLAGIYLFAGAMAALLGYLAGKKANNQFTQIPAFKTDIKSQHDFFRTNPQQRFSVWLLLIHILAIPLGLMLMNVFNVWSFLPFMTAYLLFCLFTYKGIGRRLQKPFLWFQLLIIMLLAALFWNYFSDDPSENPYEGILIGLEMCLRAVYVIIAFSSLSIELRNPRVKDRIFRSGFHNLYMALQLSFGALPAMISNLSNKQARSLKNPFLFFPLLLKQAEKWYIKMTETHPHH